MTGRQGSDEQAWANEKREFVADSRDEAADRRDAVADARDGLADESFERSHAGSQRLATFVPRTKGRPRTIRACGRLDLEVAADDGGTVRR
jgi:hypothetical protein